MEPLRRFSDRERALHWMTALACGILALTGWFIWRHEDDWELFGLNVLSQSHVWMGGVLLVAGGVVYALRRRESIPGEGRRFKPLQRLGLRFAQAALAVMTVSGILMALGLHHVLPLSRPVRHFITGVHLDAAVALAAFVALHLCMVLCVQRGILRGMVTGSIEREVARRVSPQWLAAIEAPPTRPGGSPSRK